MPSSAPIEEGAAALGIEVERKMKKAEQPPPPDAEVEPPAAKIVTGAGTGSNVAYASRFVVELGGSMAFSRTSDTTLFRFTPFFGWFIIDRLQIALSPEVLVVNVDGTTDVRAGTVLEPSYHLGLSDRVFLFAGLGLGFRYTKRTGSSEFIARPRLGADLLVGRSGILKPVLFMEIGSAGGLSAGGIEIGYTIVL